MALNTKRNYTNNNSINLSPAWTRLLENLEAFRDFSRLLENLEAFRGL